MKLSLRRTLVL